MKYKPSIVSAYFREHGLPGLAFEHRFHHERKWRFDMAWVADKVAIECDGGIWIGGGHNRGAQMLKDWEKRNEATAMGWRVFYCQPKDLLTPTMAALVKRAMS